MARLTAKLFKFKSKKASYRLREKWSFLLFEKNVSQAFLVLRSSETCK